MSDLIEKQAVIDALLSKMDTIDDKPDVVLGMAVAAGMIKDMPSALEQEPCDDAISRKDLGLTDFEIVMCDGNYKEALIMLLDKIKEAPSVQPKQMWIPVSERLPEVGSEVLVCFDFKGKRSVYIADFYGDGEFHGLDDEYLTSEGRKYRKAVAWMPLPDPYKASPTSCSTCILDKTDACTRGAGRAVDDEACEDYLASPTGAEGSEE